MNSYIIIILSRISQSIGIKRRCIFVKKYVKYNIFLNYFFIFLSNRKSLKDIDKKSSINLEMQNEKKFCHV